ncbi:hypothetical protein HYR99_15940 [Candidatus Poribacteria bacterium]|nr:hypothetical protein [Candidatus Poribacteria bacterium]
MSDDKLIEEMPDLDKLVDELENFKDYEVRGTFSAFKAICASIPGLATIADLIDNHLNLATERSIKKFIVFLATRLHQLGDRIDKELISKDEFADLFKSCFLATVRTTQEEKIKGASSILANSLLREKDSEKLSYTELDHFAHSLESLSSGAIELLGITYDFFKLADRKLADHKEEYFTNFSHLFQAFRDAGKLGEKHLFWGLAHELESFNYLLLSSVGDNALSGMVQRTLSDMTFGVALTSLGVRFVEYLLRPEKAKL